MKILAITNDFPPRVGGINYYVAHLMRRFPADEVVVFAAGWDGARAFDSKFPHHVVRWRTNSMLPTPDVTARAIDVARSERADCVLFGATVPLGRIGPHIKRTLGIPFAGFTHGVEVATARAPVVRRFLGSIGREAALLTTVSEWCREILRPVVGSRPRLELLPPGIEPELFHPSVATEDFRSRHGIDGDPVISLVSRLVPRKGQDMVIRALKRIRSEFPKVQFVIVGSGPDEKRLRALARAQGVDDAVVFTGEVPYEDLPAAFRTGDVFAMPCRNRWLGFEVEAYGAVYLQAAAVGRPSIAGAEGGAPEAVRHHETGLVVDGRNVDAVAEGTLALLRDLPLAEKMGAAGAEWVHRDLTWDAIALRLRAMLAEVLKGDS